MLNQVILGNVVNIHFEVFRFGRLSHDLLNVRTYIMYVQYVLIMVTSLIIYLMLDLHQRLFEADEELHGNYANLLHDTAGIISLLTHTCNSVALNIFLHPQLTLGHQSSCH